MAISQERPKRKTVGGMYKDYRKKRFFNSGRDPTFTKLGEKKKLKTFRVMAGKLKTILLVTNEINVLNPKTKKYSKTKIDHVLENSANRHFVRRNIHTKGTIVSTKLGKARIVSRPGQEPAINAILIE